MSDDHNESHIGFPGYLGVFAVLVIGTLFTYWSSFWDLDGTLFPGANTLLALAIAFTKMTFVMLFFMHVYWSPKLIWLSAVASFFWLAIMFAYTMQDYLTRGQGVFGG
ncbi:cytochrome C oxidase subunit IV family protein [Leptolyngbya sp. 7M]|uniref:cytochrome C oxidase subunit IV family protein n=1 Tax=Leptolyngbya sp. 7M TaxID=2812896 RepID=UPI001B8AD49D|nr:cytochrome C oxidase subunit IV family protein [Leptolyngbya sp. 7M]QYO66588.1 cytochrome C oxidase subunit IV family protein [Leptolyngbya sp. 7M]